MGRKRKVATRGPGRPRLYDESTHIKFLVPVDLVTKVKNLAEREGITMAEEFRYLIYKGMNPSR